jgi:drug/metabolite transporter (DMT)-like permease
MTRRGWLLFIALGIIWGLPYLLIKVGVSELSPIVVVFLRVASAAVILVPIAAARGQFAGLRGRWKWVALFAVMEIMIPFFTLTWAEQRISSSLAALLVAAVPMVAAVTAWRLGIDDRLTGTRVVGLIVGLVGVGFLIGLDLGGGDLLSIAAVGVTIVGYATAPLIIARKLNDAPSMAVIAAALTINAVVYAPLAWVSRPDHPVSTHVWLSLLALGVVCTALAFLVFFALIAEAGPSRSTLITYVNPAVALLLGVVILHEALTAGLIIGFPLVLLGSYLATRRAPVLEESEPHM